MAVFKSAALLLDSHDQVIGRGQAYVHLPLGLAAEQEASGTLSLTQWSDGIPAALCLPDHRRLPIQVERESLDACLAGHRILRYRTRWPPLA